VNFFLDHDVPDGLSHLLEHLGHRVHRLRDALPRRASDTDALEYALDHGLILITCNRDDFLRLVRGRPHHGIVILIRRRSRAAERAALLRLIESAGPEGLGGNINFA
jgi:predicted nuclease of predicted toxin-antitoxin system